MRNSKLFCSACREEIALKKSTIVNHIRSGEKHKKAKEAIEKRQTRELNLVEVLKAYDQQVHLKGSASVSMDARVYRVRVVEQFLKSGIPMSKIDSLRPLLEEGSHRLTHSSHLSEYIPVVYSEEKKGIKNEVEGRDVSVIFDGSTRLGEALGIVLRFFSEGCIKQRLVKIAMLSKPLTGEELAREILTALSTELGIGGSQLLAAMHDRASVNGAAMCTISIMYPTAMDIGCFSHTLDLVGTKFSLPTLDKFMKHWETIFSHSYKSKLLWRELTGIAIKTYSPTRWWSRWECTRQVMDLWGDIPKFLNNPDIAPKSREKLQLLLQSKGKELLIELAVDVDVGEVFVKATYDLEGDGPLALECYEKLIAVRNSIQVRHWPNTTAVAKRIATALQPEQYWISYASNCVQKGFDYFEDKFFQDFTPIMDAFKSARLFNPGKVTDLKPTAASVEALKAFPFFGDEFISDLKLELASYLAAADGTPRDVNPLEWWEHNKGTLPKWSQGFSKIALIQPSSASVERVFSVLKKHFTQYQHSALQDYVEVSVMLEYNHSF